MNFKILDRYIFTQVLTATIFGLILFTVIWISPEILFKIIRKFIFGEISFLLAIKLFFLEIPEILSKAIPVGLMIGSLFVFDRMSKDSELTIMRVAGVNTFRLLLPVIFISIIGMFLCFFIYNNVIPYTTIEIKTLKGDIFQQHFVYIDKKEDKKPRQILIVGGFDGKNIYDTKLLRFSDNISSETPLMEGILTAEKAEVKTDHWELSNVLKYEIAPDGIYRETKYLDTFEVFDSKSSEEAYKLLEYSTKRPREMKKADLESYLSLLKSLEMHDEYRFTLSKFYQRYARSFGCILLAVCGVLLGMSKPRERRFIGFTAGAGLIFAYYILIPLLDMLAQTGTIPPVLAAWFPDIMVLGLILLLLKFRSV